MYLTLPKKQLLYGLVFALLAQIIGISNATAQCSTSVPNFVTGGSAGSAIPFADSYVQTFKPTCNSVLTTIVFPTLYNGTDDFRGSGYFVTCIIKDASGNILATAPRTDQWYPGSTVTFDFTCFNINFTANTTYQFELKDGDANGVPVPKVWLLQRSNTASVYADGFCTIDGVAFPNSDLYGWTVNSGQNIIASATTTQTQNVTTCSRFANPSTTLLAFVNPVAPNAISGNTTAKVWIETLQPSQFVKRHYEITPATNTSTATGKVTLYFTQQEFTDFNAVNVSKLPTGPTDAAGIGNLIIEKLLGSSSNGTGLPNTYTGTPVTIDPADAGIVWNSTFNRWEVSFDVTGFGGLFVKSLPPTITASTVSSAFSACAGTVSATQTFTVSGTNLTANIVVTAPTGYEVSTASGSGFANSVTLTQSGGTVSNTTLYARLTSSATGSPSGNIALTSTGATTQNVAVSGTVNALPTITLGSVSNITTTATTFSLPYTATTGSPNQYSITAGTPNAMAGFSAVSNASLTGSPLSVTVPASAANTYNFVATVRNSTTGCVSANNNFTVTVAVPTTPFKTTWKVANNNIIIPTSTFAGAYNYTVNYRKQGTTPFTTISGQTGNCTISGLTNDDIIEVEITGVFPHFYMNDNANEKTKLLSIDAWGNQNWKSMAYSFYGCSNLTYNATDNPDLSSVTDMSYMFLNCSKFNGNVGSWTTGNVTVMRGVFAGATIFNQNIALWNTENVTTMYQMFQQASNFNQSIGNWNTGKVTDMGQVFLFASNFNQNLSQWNTANVTYMRGMFSYALNFNQPLTNWNTAKVTDMVVMFQNASAFNQDLSVLELDALQPLNLSLMLDNSGLSVANYDATLTGWASQSKTGLTLGALGLNYCAAEAARTTLTTSTTSGGKGWTITDGGKICPATLPFTTTWKVANGNIIIPTSSFTGRYDYTVKYKKKGTSTYTTISNQTGNCTISGLTDNDTIQVEITGFFPHFYMGFTNTQRDKLLSIDAWGNQKWKSMNNAFNGCSNLTYNAIDNPDLSSVTDMSGMFVFCSKFNGNIGGWNTSSITSMQYVFGDAIIFNQDISSWNTSNVITMYQLFQGATNFNQNIGNWNTGKVIEMGSVFASASNFNQDLSLWNTANVTSMRGMFSFTTKFNKPLTNWNTTKVTDMVVMFYNALAFNQDLSGLEINALVPTGMTQMLYGSGLSVTNYDATLTGWLSQNKTGLSLDATGLKYCTAEAARTTLTNPIASGGKGWTITDAGKSCAPPAPIASAQSYCPGKTVADLVATGQNIQWYTTSTGGTALATTTILTTTTYYASQTVSGIESNRTTVNVTVNAPTIATITLSPTTICAGTSGTITPTVTNGGSSYSYVWKINQVAQTTTSPTITYSNATGNDEYSFTVNPSADACPSIASVTTSLRVTPLTTPKVFIMPAIVCENTDRTLGVVSSVNIGVTPSYVWKKDGTDVSMNNTYEVINAGLGDTYSVTVTLSPDAGCYTTYTASSSLIVGCILSITSGNWEDPATWNLNRVPLTTDNAVIDNNHNVTITTDTANANKAEVRINSKLIYGNSAAKLKLGF